MSIKIINLTPHPVNILDDQNNVILSIPSAGELRLPEQAVPAGEIEVNGLHIPVVLKTISPSASLPPVVEGTFYIVSLPAAQAARRPDFLVPDQLVRDEKGVVVGCRRLARVV